MAKNNKIKSTVTLTEFLNYFDFDYCLYEGEEVMIGLIDEQGANLGDIQSDRFENSKKGIRNIVERLETYYSDYVFSGLEDELEEKGIDTSQLSWNDLYNKAIETGVIGGDEICECIFNSDLIKLDSKNKEINQEYLKEYIENFIY